MKVEKPQNRNEEILEAELDDAHTSDISEVYTLEELDELNSKTMAYMQRKFSNIKFKWDLNCKFKAEAYRFHRGGSSM